MERIFGFRLLLVPTLALLAAGCASTGPAPVDDLGSGQRRSVPEKSARVPASPPKAAGARYRVERGDTLYSIAFRHGVDYRDLAAWNGITAPYTILPGQELRTTRPAGAGGATTARLPTPATAGTPVFETVQDDVTSTPRVPEPTRPAVARSAPAPTPSLPAGAAAVPAVPAASASAPPPTPERKDATPPPAAVASQPAGAIAWRWPADGSLIARYAAGDPTRQGIDIAGSAGDPVRAAAGGTVVYSGNGLIGYGELIIVKHDASYLSAYGRNRKRLVKEGDRVAAGQVIAEMGSTGASRDSLHFEIRRNGKPVDPLGVLPRR